jgi:hypothetical protein
MDVPPGRICRGLNFFNLQKEEGSQNLNPKRGGGAHKKYANAERIFFKAKSLLEFTLQFALGGILVPSVSII